MKKLLLFLLLPSLCLGQRLYDTILVNQAYVSYISNTYQQPTLVKYKLYKGGGNCDRSDYYFTNDTKIKVAVSSSYAYSGYDKGHLANAEDFAYDCKLDELTFRYYNCVPQTPELNRGVWKRYENQVREMSQKDSLMIFCYNTYPKKKNNNLWVPDSCFKFVVSLTTKNIVLAIKCSNTHKPKVSDIKLEDIPKLYPEINYLLERTWLNELPLYIER